MHMIKWLKRKFGISELVEEQRKTNELLEKILEENSRTSKSLRAHNRAYHISEY